MDVVLDVASWALLLAGSAFVVIGGVGLLRMPDFFTRMHPAGLTDTAGAGFILLGLALQAGFTQVTVKLLLVLAFLVFTSPTSTHATARAALVAGLRPLLGEEAKTKRR